MAQSDSAGHIWWRDVLMRFFLALLDAEQEPPFCEDHNPHDDGREPNGAERLGSRRMQPRRMATVPSTHLRFSKEHPLFTSNP